MVGFEMMNHRYSGIPIFYVPKVSGWIKFQ